MKLFQRIASSNDRMKIAALEERLRAMNEALAGQQTTAGTKHWHTAIIAAFFFALEVVLDNYSGTLKQASSEVLAAMGLEQPSSEADAADAAYQKADTARALRLLLPLANRGDVRAQATLGLIYYHERGDLQNDLEAIKWFRAAAEQGDQRSPFHLGLMYSRSSRVGSRDGIASQLFSLADRSIGIRLIGIREIID